MRKIVFRAVGLGILCVCGWVGLQTLFNKPLYGNPTGVSPQGENAALYYLKAVDLLKFPESQEAQEEVLQVVLEGWYSEKTWLEELLNQNSLSFEEFEKGVQLSRCDFDFGKIYRNPYQRNPPPAEGIRKLTRLLLLKARYLEMSGDIQAAVRICFKTLDFASHIGTGSLLISKIYSLLIEKETLTTLKNLLRSKEVVQKVRLEVLEYLERFSRMHFPSVEIVGVEKMSFLALVEMVVNQMPDSGKGTVESDKPLDHRQRNIFQDLLRKTANDLADRYYGYFAKAVLTRDMNDWEMARKEMTLLSEDIKKIDSSDLRTIQNELYQTFLEDPEQLDQKLADRIVKAMLLIAVPDFFEATGYYYHVQSLMRFIVKQLRD